MGLRCGSVGQTRVLDSFAHSELVLKSDQALAQHVRPLVPLKQQEFDMSLPGLLFLQEIRKLLCQFFEEVVWSSLG